MIWNLAMMAASAEAPGSWQLHDTEAVVRQRVLDHSPDIVCLQELPGLVPYVETHAMVGSNPQTHSGNLATLVGHHLMEPAPTALTVGRYSVMVSVGSVTVANVHLEPGPASADLRFDQISTILAGCPTPHLLIAGDTNTRVDELQALAEIGLLAPKMPAATWNSRTNRFHAEGPKFTAYFSRWLITEGLSISKPWVDKAKSVEAHGSKFHVSDHFAAGATVSIKHAK